jgi:hypothetical protein
VLVAVALIGLAGRCADADDGRLAETLLVDARAGKLLEQLSMQVAKVVRGAEFCSMGVVRREQDAEVVVAHVRREIVPRDAVDAFVRFLVEDAGFQYLDQRKYSTAAAGIHAHLHGDDLEFDGVAISRRIVPMRQVIEAVVNHLQCVAQILLPTCSPGQVGKVGGDARAVRWLVVLVEADALEVEGKFFVHCDPATCCFERKDEFLFQATAASSAGEDLVRRASSTNGKARWTASLARWIKASSRTR